MHSPRVNAVFLAPAALAVCTLLLASCQWMQSGSERASTEASEGDREQLRNSVRSLELDLAKRDAELEHARAVNAALREELTATRADLEMVERHFISIERRLTGDETKASAVSAIAEAQLLLERMSADSTGWTNEEAIAEARTKLSSADELVTKANYNAAAYYATRALRILNRSERRLSATAGEADAVVVQVKSANVREGPASSFAVVAQLPYGTVVVALERRDDWYLVRMQGGLSGWIHGSLVR
ncbi:MAG: SH3 domain-containing protein [Candidatus Krumholzibacteria bacterium]|nr:SH3 domain-containing protein [Candidatus Krumholzibacteria bacterium]